MRRDRWALPAVVAVMLATTAGCSATDSQSSSPPTLPGHDRVDLNPETGQITLPVDRFFISESDYETVLNAHALAVSQCAAEQNVEIPYRPVIPEIGGSRLFGVWVESFAAQWGYAQPESPEKSAALERNMDPNYALSDRQLAAAEDCSEDPDVSQFTYGGSLPEQVAVELGSSNREALASDAANQVFDDWEQCLNEHGLRRDLTDGPYGILGATLDVTEANIHLALTDVGCKDEVNFVPRLAQIVADAQAGILDEHAADLEQMGIQTDELVSKAREYLTANT